MPLFWFGTSVASSHRAGCSGKKEELQLSLPPSFVCSGDAQQAPICCSLSRGDATTAACSSDGVGAYESCWPPSSSEIGLIFEALLNQCFSFAQESPSRFFVRKTVFFGVNSAASLRRNHRLYLRRENGWECCACLLMSSVVSHRAAMSLLGLAPPLCFSFEVNPKLQTKCRQKRSLPSS